MNETEMNLALCEKLGWKIDEGCPSMGHIRGESGWLEYRALPDHFSNSPSGLWACHCAEKTLTEGQRSDYDWCHLPDALTRDQSIISATAPQRALALYRTLCQP